MTRRRGKRPHINDWEERTFHYPEWTKVTTDAAPNGEVRVVVRIPRPKGLALPTATGDTVPTEDPASPGPVPCG